MPLAALTPHNARPSSIDARTKLNSPVLSRLARAREVRPWQLATGLGQIVSTTLVRLGHRPAQAPLA
ncbi:MAG TPA: hypothetical protein VIP57_10810, partial [Candidatus Dormibacteraeota bacterium]